MREKRLKELIKESVTEALTIEIEMEQVRDQESGQPLKHPKFTKETVFLPSFLAQVLSFQEGAMRGLQTDVSKENNKIVKIYNSFPLLIDCMQGIDMGLKKLKNTKTIKEIENESQS